MRWLLSQLVLLFVRSTTGLRYWVTMKGYGKIRRRKMRRKAGVLFLPNHPAQMDPLVLTIRLWRRWKAHPIVVEGVYYIPGLHYVLSKLMAAVSVPAFERASNSYKIMRTEAATTAVVEGLKRGENFVVYPAGRLKRTPEERVGGSSMVHEIVQRVPGVNIVLVRTTGMWGSMFSWGLTGNRPPLVESFQKGIKILLRNLIFFVPRRKVTIEFEQAPDELYQIQTRTAFNRWLEKWYNYGAGQSEEQPGEPLTLVSYSRWRLDYPLVSYQRPYHEVDVEQVPLEVQRQVVREVAQLAQVKPSDIQPQMHLFTDLGLDSLDIATLISTLEQSHGIISQSWHLDLLTVGALMALVAGKLEEEGPQGEVAPPPKGWEETKPRPPPQLPTGKTLIEAFLRNADRMGDAVACADERSGVVTYKQLKVKALAIAQLMGRFPGTHVGILLPSTVAVELIVIGCWLSGKIPVMINWTIGRRYLDHVKQVTGVQSVISSWSFLDNLDGADLTPIHDLIRPLERQRVNIRMADLRRAKKLAKLEAPALMKELGIDRLDEEATAVILFTSGTEALPKAVPLSHGNILSNQRAALKRIINLKLDTMYNVLPPFHSLGFSVTGILPLVTGIKAIYSPDPTNAPEMVHYILRYKPTVFCSAPTFIAGLLNVAQKEQLKSLKLLITGAEKPSPDLYEKMSALGSDVTILEGYGITETSPILTTTLPDQPPHGVGLPVEGVSLRIVDPISYQRVGEGEMGLILARGPNVFAGYLGDVGRDPFIELEGRKWYDTGDLGRIDRTGSLLLEGRLKRFVKIGGEMVSLPAIEAGLEEAAIKGSWGGGRTDRALAVVAVEREGERPDLFLFANFFVDLAEANEALRTLGFSNLARLRAFEHLPEMPVLGTGKINYRALTEKAESL